MHTETQPSAAQPPLTVRVFRQRFSATRKAARLARLLAVHQFHEWGVPYGSDSSDVAALIVAELAANAVTHGRVAGRDFELRLVLEAGGLLRVEVTDARAERGLPAPPPNAPPPDAETGRGLLLVEALAETWGVVDRQVGKTVWATLRVTARTVTRT
ncbi:ATP-binding protein [Streptomyces chryseus]|uniref:ATP-binding protein n=1 Tax=Streptomyces chryseus TaxID=68186 RepID=A0ABQ3DJ32_9ACTN|nr:ATP-binding protein [Streptomyces chryseus]GGW91424.1 ATP-binding protein [Streptomyces chryseus]GHA89652.1 ATP-binding protein [Streptomyces chryseus]